MAQTYLQIKRQIENLERQAEKLKNQEVAGVVERIKTAIAHYGLTAQQLGLTSAATSLGKGRASASGSSTGSRSVQAKYADGKGNVWAGRGPRPHWLRDALAAGNSLEDFASGSGAKATRKSGARTAAKRKAQGYSDGKGNAWSGFGPKPGWLKDALASGGTLEQFAVDRHTSKPAK